MDDLEGLDEEEAIDLQLPIVCGDLLIRRFLPDDFRSFRDYWTDPETFRYERFHSYTEEQIRHTIEAQAQSQGGLHEGSLFLTIVHSGEVVGDVNLSVLGDSQGEFGIKLHPAYRGKGLATRATIATLGLGFDQFRMHRIAAATDVRNVRSWRLMERVGMRREGHFLHEAFHKEEWIDVYVFAMLEDEWRDRYGPPALDESIRVRGR